MKEKYVLVFRQRPFRRGTDVHMIVYVDVCDQACSLTYFWGIYVGVYICMKTILDEDHSQSYCLYVYV